MTPDDVEIVFIPSDALAVPQQDEWFRTVTEAVRQEDGSLTMVLLRGEHGEWDVQSFMWHRPGAPFLDTVDPKLTEPVRSRVVAALQSAGKPVRSGNA